MPASLTTQRRARWLTASAVAGITAVALPTTAEAGLQTESEVIAESAQAALDALDEYRVTRSPVAYAEFTDHRAVAATVIADDLEVSPAALLDEWDDSDELKQVAMLSAFTQLGVPYRSMASKPGVGFDCSGLTTWAYSEAGIDLPRISRDQIRAAEDLDEVEVEPGDLAYYPGHVSIYVGQGLMVHSPNSGNRVEVRPLPSRSHRYGDAFTGELLEESGIISVDTSVPVPAAEVDEVEVGRRLWGRYSG